VSHHREQFVVELTQRRIRHLLRTVRKMGREPYLSSFELSLVKEAQARRQKGNGCSGFVLLHVEGGRRSTLIMVLQKARELMVIVRPVAQVGADGLGVAGAEVIVETLVVGVIEPLLQQR